MSNVTVTFTPSNVTVDETNLSVNVSQTTTNERDITNTRTSIAIR